MKKSIALVFALILMILCAIPSFAVDAKVLKGTPVVDGKLDEIYKQSGMLSVDKSKYVYGLQGKSNASSVSYFLWDNEFLYVCTVVQDDTILDTGIVSNWMADSVEMWIMLSAKTKSSVDAFNHPMYGDSPLTGGKQATTRQATQYTVEISIPLSKLGKIADGSKLAVSMQINDTWTKTPANAMQDIAAYGSQKMDDSLVFSNTAVIVETTAAATTAATTKAAATSAAKTTAAAAKTADLSVVIGAFAAVTLAGVVVCRKKH